MKLFRRLPCIKMTRDGVNVRGDDYDVARMMIGGMLALEKMGYDMSAMKVAIYNLKKCDAILAEVENGEGR